MSEITADAIDIEASEARSDSLCATTKRLHLPPAVVRFAVRKAVDADEVQINWGVDFGDCGDLVDRMTSEQIRALAAITEDLPGCSGIVVQGLAHLSLLDQAAGRCGPGEAGPLAIKAAMLCAMHQVMVKDAALPVIRRKKSEVRVPMMRLPEGWRVEVDVAEVAHVPRQQSDDGDPSLPYGRFLWVAINGEKHRLEFSASRSIKALAAELPASIKIIQASPNVVAQANTPIGAMVLTRHVVERACERITDEPGPARAAARIVSGLFGYRLVDVTSAMRSIRKRNPLSKSVQMFAQHLGSQLVMYVVRPSRSGGAAALVTMYEVPAHNRAIVLDAMRRSCNA